MCRQSPHALLPDLPAQDPTGEAASVAQKHLTFYELDLGLNHVVRGPPFRMGSFRAASTCLIGTLGYEVLVTGCP